MVGKHLRDNIEEGSWSCLHLLSRNLDLLENNFSCLNSLVDVFLSVCYASESSLVLARSHVHPLLKLQKWNFSLVDGIKTTVASEPNF